MSATGRGSKRVEADFYPTPAKAVRHLLRDVALPGGRWLEPGAGDGSIIRAVKAIRGDVSWTAIELQERMLKPLMKFDEVKTLVRGDFLKEKTSPVTLPVTLGNPPYSRASEFVQRAIMWSDQVVFLLRLNWLGSSSKRRHVFERLGVPDVFVLAERPSFWGSGSDASDYAWMRWRRGGQKGITTILWGDR